MTDKRDPIYHYCPFGAFRKIMRTRVLWLTGMFSTNDSEEHRWFLKIAAKVIEELTARPGTHDGEIIDLLKTTPVDPDEQGDIYLSCFSNRADSLGQWRGYADDGRGVTIGFCRQYMETKREDMGADNYGLHDLTVLDVEYNKERQEELVAKAIEQAERCLREAAPNKSKIEHFDFIFRNRLRGIIWGNAARCKHPAFEEEQEVRVVYYPRRPFKKDGDLKLGYRPTRSGITRYYELPISVTKQEPKQPIKEIILGPRTHPGCPM